MKDFYKSVSFYLLDSVASDIQELVDRFGVQRNHLTNSIGFEYNTYHRTTKGDVIEMAIGALKRELAAKEAQAEKSEKSS